MAKPLPMNTSPSPHTGGDLAGDPNLFPNTGITLATRALLDRVNWLAVVDQILPWHPVSVSSCTSVNKHVLWPFFEPVKASKAYVSRFLARIPGFGGTRGSTPEQGLRGPARGTLLQT